MVKRVKRGSDEEKIKKGKTKQGNKRSQGAKGELEEGSSVTKKVFKFMDGTQERELDSQLSFCILKKKISVGPAMKVLDSNGFLKPGIEVAELTPIFNL